MTIRSWATKRLQEAYPEGLVAPPVMTWPLSRCKEFLADQSRMRRFLVAADMAWGQLGTDSVSDQCTTISFRCARSCALDHPPMWALLLGVALETINPGHLMSSWIADYCRARLMLGI